MSSNFCAVHFGLATVRDTCFQWRRNCIDKPLSCSKPGFSINLLKKTAVCFVWTESVLDGKILIFKSQCEFVKIDYYSSGIAKAILQDQQLYIVDIQTPPTLFNNIWEELIPSPCDSSYFKMWFRTLISSQWTRNPWISLFRLTVSFALILMTSVHAHPWLCEWRTSLLPFYSKGQADLPRGALILFSMVSLGFFWMAFILPDIVPCHCKYWLIQYLALFFF